jgi:hypothetical protein
MYLLKRVWRLPLAQKALLMEALVLLALARLAVLLLPFRRVARLLGRQYAQTPELHDPKQAAVVRCDAAMVGKAAKNVPWTSKCLDQALAARLMLARRGITATVYFGVKNGEQGQLEAHAWLRSGAQFVTGGENRDRFTVINTFA